MFYMYFDTLYCRLVSTYQLQWSEHSVGVLLLLLFIQHLIFRLNFVARVDNDECNLTYITTCTLQVEMLDEAHRLLPNAKWWIKADGCDVVKSLEESLRYEWKGDVDLGHGECQRLHREYLDRLQSLTSLTSDIFVSEGRQHVVSCLQSLKCRIVKDLDFMHKSG